MDRAWSFLENEELKTGQVYKPNDQIQCKDNAHWGFFLTEKVLNIAAGDGSIWKWIGIIWNLSINAKEWIEKQMLK